MFACFFSLNQCLSHSWTYSSCPLIFQKLQSRHQHISFSHFFVYSGDIQFVLPLTFIYLSLPSFLSVSTFIFIYLSLPSFFIYLYLLFYLSVSTFFYIYLYLLFIWKIIFFSSTMICQFFLTIMGFKWTFDMIKNCEKKVVKIMFFHLL